MPCFPLGANALGMDAWRPGTARVAVSRCSLDIPASRQDLFSGGIAALVTD